jgi:hypothetical protein
MESRLCGQLAATSTTYPDSHPLPVVRGKLYEATFVMYPFGFTVGGMRKFSGGKTAKMLALPVKSNLGIPPPSRFVQRDAKQAAGLIAYWRITLILLVCAVAYLSQVCEAIVRSVAIHVVNLLQRPFSGHVEPREAVGLIRGSVTADTPVSIAAIKTPGALSIAASWTAFRPCECTSLRIVVEKFVQFLRGKIGLSHDAVLSLIGQRPACVSSTRGPRHFISCCRDM